MKGIWTRFVEKGGGFAWGVWTGFLIEGGGRGESGNGGNFCCDDGLAGG